MMSIREIAYAARCGDLSAINATLDAMSAKSCDLAIVDARARADRDMGRPSALPQTAGGMLEGILRERAAPPRVPAATGLPAKKKQKQRKSANV